MNKKEEKLYILVYSDYDAYDIYGIYSTRKRAENAKKREAQVLSITYPEDKRFVKSEVDRLTIEVYVLNKDIRDYNEQDYNG